MRQVGAAVLLVCVLFGLMGTSVAAPATTSPLTVCLEKKSGLLSWERGAASGGFDVVVAQVVARRLGRPLRVQWFALSDRPESDKTPDNALEDALLSDHRCELIGGYPLLANMLGTPSPDRSRLPRYDGAAPDDLRREIALQAMAASDGYHFLGITVLLAPTMKPRAVTGLDDLTGLTVGVEEGTLGDVILQTHRGGALVAKIREFVPGAPLAQGGGVLDRLERGDIDAAFIETNGFDAYRADHPATRIVPTGYIDAVGFNLGFAGLASDATLLGQVNGALRDLAVGGELQALAKQSRITFIAPRQPELREISLQSLTGGKKAALQR